MDSCGNYGVLDSNPADPNYGYYTNAATYPLNNPFVYSITNYTVILDTNNVPISTNSNTMTLINDLYLTTYYVNEISTNSYIIPGISTNMVLVTNTAYLFNTANFPQPLNSLFDGGDTNINQIVFGDGVLDVCDVYVTFRRSLDRILTWFRRFWNNGQRVADTGAPKRGGGSGIQSFKPRHASQSTGWRRSAERRNNSAQVNFTAGDFIGSAGQTVQFPLMQPYSATTRCEC